MTTKKKFFGIIAKVILSGKVIKLAIGQNINGFNANSAFRESVRDVERRNPKDTKFIGLTKVENTKEKLVIG